MPSAPLSRSVALEPTRLSLSVTSTRTLFARSWASSRHRQPPCIFLATTPGSFTPTWRRSKVQIDLPTPDHYTIRERFQSARVILEHDRCGAAAAGLLDLLRNLH